jgi:hypothetical protein
MEAAVRDMAKPDPPRREQVFLATIAVDAERYSPDCSRALSVLRQAGYTAADEPRHARCAAGGPHDRSAVPGDRRPVRPAARGRRMTQVLIEVEVTVLDREPDAAFVALEMVKDSLSRRLPKWQTITFVSEGDVGVRGRR